MMAYRIKRRTTMTAVCHCGRRIVSAVRYDGRKRGSAKVQGINCPDCRQFHIFAQDTGHTETVYRNTDIVTFYRQEAALDSAGILPFGDWTHDSTAGD